MTSLPKCIVNTKGKPFVLFHKICYETYITAFCFTTFNQSDRQTDRHIDWRQTRVDVSLLWRYRLSDAMTSSYEGYSWSNVTQQSSKGSLFTNFEDVEVMLCLSCHSFRLTARRYVDVCQPIQTSRLLSVYLTWSAAAIQYLDSCSQLMNVVCYVDAFCHTVLIKEFYVCMYFTRVTLSACWCQMMTM